MAGKVVKTKSGLIGKTENNDNPTIHGKIIVYLTDGKKIICDPAKLKIIGLWE